MVIDAEANKVIAACGVRDRSHPPIVIVLCITNKLTIIHGGEYV